LLTAFPTESEKSTKQIRQKRETPSSCCLGGNRVPRSYHLTGGESYYGRKPKCKRFARIFLQIFYKVICAHGEQCQIPNRAHRVDSLVPCIRDSVQETEIGVGRRIGLRGRRPLLRTMQLKTTNAYVTPRNHPVFAGLGGTGKLFLRVLLPLLLAAAIPLAGRTKDKLPYGEPLIVNIPMPEGEVEQVVVEVAQNGIIRGTKEYNKDEFVAGAKAASSSHVFPAWDQGGKVFYKVREQAIDPRNFKDTSDVGTLAVRYVLQAQGEKNTVLRIEALFKEDYRHIVHQSDGSVESAEYKDIREHLDEIENMKRQNVEAENERQEKIAKKQSLAMRNSAAPSPANPWPGQPTQATQSSPVRAAQAVAPAPASSEPAPAGPARPGQTLEQRVKDLRMQVERLVKSPGAPLKSAPFHTAGTLQLLSTGTEVLIVISTPYWYGVETHDGQHGWMQKDQLELLP
jgi:hypothetical protein